MKMAERQRRRRWLEPARGRRQPSNEPHCSGPRQSGVAAAFCHRSPCQPDLAFKTRPAFAWLQRGRPGDRATYAFGRADGVGSSKSGRGQSPAMHQFGWKRVREKTNRPFSFRKQRCSTRHRVRLRTWWRFPRSGFGSSRRLRQYAPRRGRSAYCRS